MTAVFPDRIDIALRVNGEEVEARVPAGRHLVDFLRLDLGLTGAHASCEHGVCGACTVRVDGQAVRGCRRVAVQVDGLDVSATDPVARPRHFEDNNVAPFGLGETRQSQVGKGQARSVRELVHEEVVSNQERREHRTGWNPERLDQELTNRKRNRDRDDQRDDLVDDGGDGGPLLRRQMLSTSL